MTDDELAVEVENVGGIDRETYTFEAGVTLVAGPNASNKTSLLSALAFGIGTDEVPMRTAADEARVVLRRGDETIERTATRDGRGMRTGGEPWIADDDVRTAFRTFGCLLEFNGLRSAVRRGDPVEDHLKAPVDVDDLERRRSEKLSEKRTCQRAVEDLSGLADDLARTRSELEAKRERVGTLESRLEDLYDRREEDDEDDETRELRERRNELVAERDRYAEQAADLEEAISEYEGRESDVDERIERLEADLEGTDVDSLRAERSELRERLAEREERIEILQSALSTNREIVNAGYTGLFERDAGLVADTMTCWACGQEADESEIEETVSDLSELVAAEKERKREFEPRIEELTERIESHEDRRATASDLRQQRQSVERTLVDRRESLETKRERIAELRDELDEVEAALAERERETADSDELVEEIEETSVALQAAKRDVERLETKREDLREKRAERERKRETIDRLTDEITALTDRIESLESDLRSAFNDAMDELLDVLEFDGIERVRLDGSFDIVVAREIDGEVRRDALEHLSESEREAVGLVLGLAGYDVHDVPQAAPVLLLDSLDAFDAVRTERLLSFFEDRTDFLIAAVLPETATELDAFDRIAPATEPPAPD